MLAEYYVPGFLIAFIVPVFVAIGRRAPKAKAPLAVIAFIFLGIQCVLNIVYIFTNGSLVRIGRWALSNLINGSHVLTGIGAALTLPLIPLRSMVTAAYVNGLK